jgi:hypothetical protein
MLRDVDVLAYARRDTLNRGPDAVDIRWRLVSDHREFVQFDPDAHVVKARLSQLPDAHALEHACGEIYIIQEAYDSLELGSSLNEELEQVLDRLSGELKTWASTVRGFAASITAAVGPGQGCSPAGGIFNERTWFQRTFRGQ